MDDDFEQLRSVIGKAFPSAQLTPVPEHHTAQLGFLHLGILEHYLDFLRRVGWGVFHSEGFMLYDGSADPRAVFGENVTDSLRGVLIIGDSEGDGIWGSTWRRDTS
jgi:hypothetical protein